LILSIREAIRLTVILFFYLIFEKAVS
jgi:hypothetical protein